MGIISAGPSAMSAAHFVHVATTDRLSRQRKNKQPTDRPTDRRQSFYGREWELKSLVGAKEEREREREITFEFISSKSQLFLRL